MRSKASTLSVVPVISTMIERFVTSTTLPRKISQICMTSRAGAVDRDLEERELAGDRCRPARGRGSSDVDELVQLLGDLVDRVQRAVDGQRHRDRRSSSVGPTVSVSMLKPRPREQAGDPGQDTGLFSTRIDRTCLRPVRRPAAASSSSRLSSSLVPARPSPHPTMSRAAAAGAIIG
jgi:hypothetical protein